MSGRDIVVTVPQTRWRAWIAEGDLPGDPDSGSESHYTIAPLPDLQPGARVYVVAHGRLRGYAPLVRVEKCCRLFPGRSCLVRRGGAVAVTIPTPMGGFRGWRYRWWDRADEVPFPEWASCAYIAG